MIRIGPAGVTDGRGIWAWDDGGKDKIVQIFIAHGDCIDSLQYVYVDQNGNLVLSNSHGGTFGTSKFDLVKFNYPSELITGIKGTYGNRGGVGSVNSISFTTNKATYGRFGYHANGDTEFDFQIGGHNKFCGFHGTSDLYLHSIGFYMEPMTTLSDVNVLQEKANIKNEKV
ncbi:hypothetical protein RHMOL_Rhmol04G0371500 [Rhododendron molle]|uniref:Uncharacterized protein n=1 Tax=Rhododendron molle TaxID=49168 RepID=A0ACC0P9D3_RHOML|nr:hypothetical protein RHMOL_Rhmol04G0371500 [Rhododendron molle]